MKSFQCCPGKRLPVPSPDHSNPAAVRLGFSLVELMVVMVIMGMLVGLAAVRYRSYLISSKQYTAKTQIATIVKAIETFYAQEGRYPTTDEGIQILADGTAAWPDGYLDKVPVDPWKRPYEYISPGSTRAVRSGLLWGPTDAKVAKAKTEISPVNRWTAMRKFEESRRRSLHADRADGGDLDPGFDHRPGLAVTRRRDGSLPTRAGCRDARGVRFPGATRRKPVARRCLGHDPPRYQRAGFAKRRGAIVARASAIPSAPQREDRRYQDAKKNAERQGR